MRIAAYPGERSFLQSDVSIESKTSNLAGWVSRKRFEKRSKNLTIPRAISLCVKNSFITYRDELPKLFLYIETNINRKNSQKTKKNHFSRTITSCVKKLRMATNAVELLTTHYKFERLVFEKIWKRFNKGRTNQSLTIPRAII